MQKRQAAGGLFRFERRQMIPPTRDRNAISSASGVATTPRRLFSATSFSLGSLSSLGISTTALVERNWKQIGVVKIPMQQVESGGGGR
jgi:hypothetical protein